MDKYKLQPNESFILSNDSVYHGNMTGELILTNLNIVYVKAKGVFKTTYISQTFPINQIKVVNGKVQVVLGKDGNIDIHFINGVESFKFVKKDMIFSNKKAENEANRWIAAIKLLIKDRDYETSTKVSSGLATTEAIAGTIKDTLDIFKEVIIGKTNKNQVLTKTAKKCIYCGAPISGEKGQIIRCEYCDGDVEI